LLARNIRSISSCGVTWVKKAAGWLWWAIDRAPKKVCGWALGDHGTETAKCLDAPLPHAGHITFRADGWHPCGIISENPRHLQGKARTFAMERHHNRLRRHLARLRGKTHCHTKNWPTSPPESFAICSKNNINTYLAIPICRSYIYRALYHNKSIASFIETSGL
jgi:IS1 family transposase